MKKTTKSLPAVFLLWCLAFFSGCSGQTPVAQEPAAFLSHFIAAVQSGDEKALAAYEGNTYSLNTTVDSIVPGKYISVRCADNIGIRVYVPQEELETLSRDAVIALEGTVKEVQLEKYGDIIRAEMILEPAHIIGNTFEVTGEVEEIFHDWERDGQDYAAIWDSSVVLERQINIYLPEGHNVQVGDCLTAQGALQSPTDFGQFSIGYIRGRKTPVVFVMPEPEFVQKEVSE